MYAEQAYRKIERGEASTVRIVRGHQETDLSIKQVESYKTPVYISDKAQIKPKLLNSINQNTEKAMKKYGIPAEEKPAIVIVADDELRNALGLYDPCTNTVYYNQAMTSEEVQNLAGGKAAVEYHEMWHARQAYGYRSTGKEITEENKGEYLQALCSRAKKNLDGLGITQDNVGEISEYAEKQFIRGRFDEVEAEYMTLRKGVK